MFGDVIDPDTVFADVTLGIDARWVVTSETTGAESVTLGRATYSPGARVPTHRHVNAEEVVVVVSGQAEHVIGGRRSLMKPGDVCFIPRMAAHSMANPSPDQDLVILWAYGGAASLQAAGFEPLE